MREGEVGGRCGWIMVAIEEGRRGGRWGKGQVRLGWGKKAGRNDAGPGQLLLAPALGPTTRGSAGAVRGRNG